MKMHSFSKFMSARPEFSRHRPIVRLARPQEKAEAPASVNVLQPRAKTPGLLQTLRSFKAELPKIGRKAKLQPLASNRLLDAAEPATDAHYVNDLINTMASLAIPTVETRGKIAHGSSRLIDSHTLPDQLKQVGDTQLIGCVAWDQINKVVVDEITEKFREKELSTAAHGLKRTSMMAGPGPAYYVFDERLLNRYLALPKQQEVLKLERWPSEAQAFVKAAATRQVRTQAMVDLLNRCFDTLPVGDQSERVDLSQLRSTAHEA